MSSLRMKAIAWSIGIEKGSKAKVLAQAEATREPLVLPTEAALVGE